MEREAHSTRNTPELAAKVALYNNLIDQDLGVIAAGWGFLPRGKGNGFLVWIEKGMPIEFKELLATVAPDGDVTFVEMSEERIKVFEERKRYSMLHTID